MQRGTLIPFGHVCTDERVARRIVYVSRKQHFGGLLAIELRDRSRLKQEELLLENKLPFRRAVQQKSGTPQTSGTPQNKYRPLPQPNILSPLSKSIPSPLSESIPNGILQNKA